MGHFSTQLWLSDERTMESDHSHPSLCAFRSKASWAWLFSLSLEFRMCYIASLGDTTVPVNESESEDMCGNMFIASLLDILGKHSKSINCSPFLKDVSKPR